MIPAARPAAAAAAAPATAFPNVRRLNPSCDMATSVKAALGDDSAPGGGEGRHDDDPPGVALACDRAHASPRDPRPHAVENALPGPPHPAIAAIHRDAAAQLAGDAI